MAGDPTSSSTHTATSTQLLEGLKDPHNRTVWQQYVERYHPLILRCAYRLGVKGEQAEDAAQQALIAFSTAYREGRYERAKGRLRDWMFGIVRIQILNWYRRQRRREVQVGAAPDATDFFEALGSEDQLAEIWEQEWRAAVMRRCLDEIRLEIEPRTLQAFDLFALQGWPAERVAESLDITPNAVFGAKRRVLRRLREILPAIEETW